MEYKGYVGRVEFEDEAGIFHGEVVGTRDVITFQGQTVGELRAAFEESVDDYLAFCRERGEEPDRPFSGQFVTRIAPELHRQISLAAGLSRKSLNAWVSEQLQSAVADTVATGVNNAPNARAVTVKNAHRRGRTAPAQRRRLARSASK
ncbi:MAG: type II toxin-antitoxin system HicB family antitoxin [Planctomycetes bacterium]|nr:type II toxin-antitoxin system HicB family antitoxin [Planctomycetota bacterium]